MVKIREREKEDNFVTTLSFYIRLAVSFSLCPVQLGLLIESRREQVALCSR